MPDKKQQFKEDTSWLMDEYRSSKQFVDQFTRDFKDLDNLVDGVSLSHEKNAPFIGDTTLAGLVRQVPRMAIQQIPVFGVTVNGTKQSISAQVCNYLLRRVVFNQDTFGKGILSTLQIGTEQALTHGYAPFMVATGQMYNDFGPSIRLIRYQDTAPEQGIQDHNETDFDFVKANLTRSRIRKILKAAKDNPNTSWNVKALEAILEQGPQGGIDGLQDLSEPRYTPGLITQKSTYDVITRYPVGNDGEFITFTPQYLEPLRVIPTKSKFGYPRVMYLVIDPAPLTPFGLSRVRLASPSQNYANVYLQSTAKMLLLNGDPPLLQRGRFSTPVQLKRGARWVAQDQNAQAELKELSNSTLNQFIPVLQFLSGQIHSIFGVPPGTINGNDNSSGYSKTGPGVRMQESDRQLSVTQLTNILENFLRQYALVGLDTHISEQTGQTELIVDDECKNAINRIAPDTVGDDNTLLIDWAQFYDGIKDWTVEIELSIGKEEFDKGKREDLQDMIVTMEQNADPMDIEKQQRIRQLQDMLLEKTVPESQRLSPEPASPQIPMPPQAGGEQPPMPQI